MRVGDLSPEAVDGDGVALEANRDYTVRALYYYLLGPAMPPPAVRAMMYPQVLETVGVAFPVYVSWD